MSQTIHSTPRLGQVLEASHATRDNLHFLDLGFLGDSDQALLVCGAGPDREYHVRVYAEKDLARVRDLRQDETVRVLDMGRAAERAAPRPRNVANEKTEPQTETDASIQTELEAQFSQSTELLGQVKTMFNDFQVGSCPESWEPVTEAPTLPVITGSTTRRVPFMVVAHTCFFGNYGVVKTLIPIQDPIFGGQQPSRVRVCSTQFKVSDVRKVSLKHSVKSTKVGFGFSLGFMPSIPLPSVGDMVDTSPKEGDQAFEKGKPKKDPATGKNISFDFELARTHAKLKFEAWQRLVLDVGPDMFVCRDA